VCPPKGLTATSLGLEEHLIVDKGTSRVTMILCVSNFHDPFLLFVFLPRLPEATCLKCENKIPVACYSKT
jgi:hypothetical protein